MPTTMLGTKREMIQTFLADGTRIPVTVIQAGPCLITQVKTKEKDGYQAIQLGIGSRKRASSKPLSSHLKEAMELAKKSADEMPRFLREVRVDEVDKVAVGDVIMAADLFKPSDLVNITGISRGKGFIGVVKRWGFKGGPRTHGQSDRERAPGSIGQTTTPGRVYKGKRMAGRGGTKTVTIRNLLVVKVENNGELWVKGQVPGARNGLLIVRKVGESQKFPGLSGQERKNEEKESHPEESEKEKKNQKSD